MRGEKKKEKKEKGRLLLDAPLANYPSLRSILGYMVP